MGGSVKKVVKKALPVAAGVGLAGPVGGVVGYAADKAIRNHKKSEAKDEQRKADNAILTKEVESTNAAARAFEAEEKKKEKRQMGLGSAISGSESSLG
jgi:zinc transporter ZupT